MLKRLFLMGIGTLFVVLLLAACGGDDDDGTPATTDDTAATPTPTAAVTPADDTADDDDLADFDDDFEPFEFAEGESIFELAGVNSFRQRWSMTFSGPGAEATGMAGSSEVMGEFVRDPLALRTSVTDIDGTVMFELIRIGDDAWFGGGGMGWQQMPAGSVPLDPADMMMTGAMLMPGHMDDAGLFTRVASEQLNGRQTTRYSLDTAALFQFMQLTDAELADADITEGRVDYWVDDGGRFLVKYEMVIEGTGLDMGFDDFDDLNGDLATDQPIRMEMIFELFDFDAAISIEPPQ